MPFSDYRSTLFFFDEARFLADLESKPAITVFKDALAAAKQQFNIRFTEGESIRTLVREHAHFTDLIIHHAWLRFDWPENFALLAVGGYGRAELHPYSDIDLLILLGCDKQTEQYRDSIEGLITFLWDISLTIGQSVRTVKDCAKLAKQDLTIATALMECRTLAGADKLRDQMLLATGPDKLWPADKFFQAKWDEQIARHQEFNDTEYNLEPHVKNAPGGLRDIQMIAWTTKRHFLVRSLKELHGREDFFTEEEYATLRYAQDFIWRVRWGLHMLADRAEERLLFDHQRELATLFGYKDSNHGFAVEKFMKDYYRAALAVTEINDVLLHYLDENILHTNKRRKVVAINQRFQLVDGYIECVEEDTFDKHHSALLEIFVLMGDNPQIKGIHTATIRDLRSARFHIDDDFRADPYNKQLFITLLRSRHMLVSQLRRMKRYGILSRYLPEFGKIIGQMQHDLFHIYTVDAHTLQVVENLRRLRRPEAAELFPIAASAFKRLHKPELLYTAGLFHDIGKGRGGDHSKLGAVDAREFCEQHMMSRWDTKLVVWLVEKHLLMSAVSQKQDISDPEIIHNFAEVMGDEVRLNYLFCLTVADINGTNPTLWNNWRASLLNQLYQETLRALRSGLEQRIDPQDWIEETQQEALSLLEKTNVTTSDIEPLWQSMGDTYFLRERSDDISWHTENIINKPNESPLILMRTSGNNEHEAITQVFIRTLDRDHIFAAAASALDNLNLNILDAHLYTSSSGHTLDTFFVLDDEGQPLATDKATQQHLVSTIKKELILIDDYDNIIKRRTPRQLKHFAYPTRTTLKHNDEYSILEVITPDRPGLLACIARVFIEYDIELENAKIATLGERVEDIFFITNENRQPINDKALAEKLQDAICDALDSRNDADENIPVHS